MWRQAKVTVGDKSADQALVDFRDKTPDKPEVLEWPERVEPNATIKVGTEKRYAGRVDACAGMFHVELLLSPVVAAVAEAEPEAPATEQVTKKGTKR